MGYIDSKEQQSVKNIFHKGEILFGKLRPYLKKYWMADFDGVCSTEFWVLNGKKVTNDYLFQLIQTNKFNQIANISSGSKMPRADWKYMSEIPFDIPPLKEQEKIAQILTTWDKAISKQKELIKAKEKLKKGLMQRLLSAEVRFREFSDEWEEVKLWDVGRIIGGGTPKTTNVEYWGNEILWFTPTEIKNKYIFDSKRKISKLGLKKSSARLLPKNTLLLTTRATIGDIGISQKECTTNQGFQSIIVNDKNYYEYLYYWLLKNKKELLKRANGSTFIEISKKDIEKIPFKKPPLQEQQKIAEVLSMADKEIELLKKELEELKKQKKGLMQRLLTADVRVKV